MINFEQEMALRAINEAKTALDSAYIRSYCDSLQAFKLRDCVSDLRRIEDKILKDAKENDSTDFDPRKPLRG